MFLKCNKVLRICKLLVTFWMICCQIGPLSAQSEQDLDSFFRAVTDGRSEEVGPMLQQHPDWVDRELFLGIRPLYRAAVLGRSEVAQILIESGADVAATTDRGTQALHAASQNGHVAIVMMLLASEAPTAALNESGASPLHLAARYKREKVVDLLLKNGVDPNQRDAEGATPLHIAAGLGQPDLVRLLVEAGAELSPIDKAGYSPLGWARTAQRNSFGDVGGYLEAKGAQDIRPPSTPSKNEK